MREPGRRTRSPVQRPHHTSFTCAHVPQGRRGYGAEATRAAPPVSYVSRHPVAGTVADGVWSSPPPTGRTHWPVTKPQPATDDRDRRVWRRDGMTCPTREPSSAPTLSPTSSQIGR